MHDHRPPAPQDWRDAFSALPLEAPPPGGWEALSARLDARRPAPATSRPARPARWTRWAAGMAAAAVAFTLVSPWRSMPEQAPEAAPEPVATVGQESLERLYAESAQLESLLAAARDERVSSATAALLADTLEARLAAIDAALAQPDLDRKTQAALWEQRVEGLRALTGFESNRRWLVAQGTRYDAALVLVD